MLINVTHDYALRMCAYLARKGGCASSREIADATGVPRDYLVQIAQKLRDAGIVYAIPGKHGGYGLAKEPSAIAAFDVIYAIEGHDGREKSREASRVSVAIVEALSRTTVEDVVR